MNPFSKLTCPVLACVPLIGLFGAAILFATPTAFAALPTVTVSQTWSDYLNDAPCGVAISSPTEFNDEGVPAVEVGDREGDRYAVALQSGAPLPGWTSNAGQPRHREWPGMRGQQPRRGQPQERGRGQPAAERLGGARVAADRLHRVRRPQQREPVLGGGNAAVPGSGGYYAYTANGALCLEPGPSPTQARTPRTTWACRPHSPSVTAGSPSSRGAPLANRRTGSTPPTVPPAAGWPQFSADSVFSTAAVGDLYGTGTDNFVFGRCLIPGRRLRHPLLRRRTAADLQRPRRPRSAPPRPPKQIDSSPAIGPILPGGAYGDRHRYGQLLGIDQGDAAR